MTRRLMTLVPFALALAACAHGPPEAASEVSSALDTVHRASAGRNADCNRPPLGKVCVRMIDATGGAPCACVDGAALRAMPIWPEFPGD